MSFYYHIDAINVRIPAERVPEAAKILRSDVSDSDSSLLDINVLSMVAERNLYHITVEKSGDVIVVRPDEGINYSDNTGWLRKVASCIQIGSYIQVRDDDDNAGRLIFSSEGIVSSDPVPLIDEE